VFACVRETQSLPKFVKYDHPTKWTNAVRSMAKAVRNTCNINYGYLLNSTRSRKPFDEAIKDLIALRALKKES